MRRSTSLAILWIACLPWAAVAGKKKAVSEPYGLIAVSVFQESGFALPDAQVTLTPDPGPDSAPVQVKRMQATSSSRGECVFRVPPAAMRYSLKAVAKGFQSQEKAATVNGEERVDVTFQLQPESK